MFNWMQQGQQPMQGAPWGQRPQSMGGLMSMMGQQQPQGFADQFAGQPEGMSPQGQTPFSPFSMGGFINSQPAPQQMQNGLGALQGGGMMSDPGRWGGQTPALGGPGNYPQQPPRFGGYTPQPGMPGQPSQGGRFGSFLGSFGR